MLVEREIQKFDQKQQQFGLKDVMTILFVAKSERMKEKRQEKSDTIWKINLEREEQCNMIIQAYRFFYKR